jgi:hypothetical protein
VEWYWQGELQCGALVEWYWQGELQCGALVEWYWQRELQCGALVEWYWQGELQCGALVEWYWQGKIASTRGKISVPLRPPQISHGLTWNRTRSFAVSDRQLTDWDMTRPLEGKNESTLDTKFQFVPRRERAWSSAALLVGRFWDRFPVVSLDFSVTHSFRPYHGPGVDSAPSENEYQEHFLGVKAAGAWGWQTHHLHVPNVLEIWEPKLPGTLWSTPGLLLDSFTFYRGENTYWYSLQYKEKEQQASTAVYLRIPFFWDVTSCHCVCCSLWRIHEYTVNTLGF